MKIEILGTRGKVEPFAEGYRKHTGILIDDNLLVDVGEEEYLNFQPRAILFTHYHPDHAFFVVKDQVFKEVIPHYGPEPHPLLPNVQVIHKQFELGGYLVRPVPVLHALHLKSFGYLIEKEDRRILITGDVAWIEKGVLEQLPSLDLVCTEATFLRKGGRINRKGNRIFGHTGVPDLIRILSPYTNRILFAHYGEWFFSAVEAGPDRITTLAPEGLELIAAKDGFVINI